MIWIIVIVSFFTTSVAYAEIYRWLDDNGGVVYSDRSRPDADIITLSPPVVYIPATIKTVNSASDNRSNDDNVSAIYDIHIISPKQDESLWLNDGKISVLVSVEPELDSNSEDVIMIMLDGQQPQTVHTGTTLQLENLERGTHSVSAYIVSALGEHKSETVSARFHLHRASQLHHPNPN